MKITKEMLDERINLLNEYINSYNDYVKRLLISVNQNTSIKKSMNGITELINEQVVFSNTINAKDRYVFLDVLIKFIDQLIIFIYNFNNKEKNELLNKELNKAAKKVRNTRRKIEKHYGEDDDDDEFFDLTSLYWDEI